MSKFPDPNFRPRRSSLRAPYSRSEAAQILAHQRASGLTIGAYGRVHSLEVRQLYDWRAKLGLSPPKPAKTAAQFGEKSLPTTALAFVPVVAVSPVSVAASAAAPTEGGASGVELAIGDVAVHLRRGFCGETLTRALAILTKGAA